MYGGRGICPRLIQNLLKNSIVGKLDQTVSFLHYVDDRSL